MLTYGFTQDDIFSFKTRNMQSSTIPRTQVKVVEIRIITQQGDIASGEIGLDQLITLLQKLKKES